MHLLYNVCVIDQYYQQWNQHCNLEDYSAIWFPIVQQLTTLYKLYYTKHTHINAGEERKRKRSNYWHVRKGTIVQNSCSRCGKTLSLTLKSMICGSHINGRRERKRKRNNYRHVRNEIIVQNSCSRCGNTLSYSKVHDMWIPPWGIVASILELSWRLTKTKIKMLKKVLHKCYVNKVGEKLKKRKLKNKRMCPLVKCKGHSF